MAALERVVQIIGESIAEEVESTAFANIVHGTRNAVDSERVARAAAARLESEGLIA